MKDHLHVMGFQGGASGKEPACQCRRCRDVGSIFGLGRSPGGGNDNLLQCSLPGESRGQRSLVGYSPQGRKESDTTETNQHARIYAIFLGQWLV